ncbi:sensor histidine kinase [Haloglomus halophilum]|uniref:sensor histidine kinase n=1 Tax=Haloglomus halophilum TaxID=2962672 RepID=UPI0020CA1317|nr:ATP-binding protein [Haloglomus halophilum]
MITDSTAPVRVVQLVTEAEGSSRTRHTEATDRSGLGETAGLVVVRTTEDPERAATAVTAGEADCVVALGADPAAALDAVRADTADIPFLAILPRDDRIGAQGLLAAPAADVVWADDELLPELVARRAAALVAAADVETLRWKREQVDHALDSLTDLFYVIDADGRMVRWNRRFNERWGLTDAEIAETWPWEFLVEDDWAAVQEAIGQTLSEGEASARVRAALPDGRTPMLELQGRRLTDDHGNILGLCGTGRDISEQAAREDSLRTRNEQLDEFAAVLSHDLRNPLSVAIGSLDIARAERDTSDLERTADALARLNDLIDDILTAARQDRTVIDPVPVSLRAISQAAWNSVSTHGATLEVTTDIVIRADPTRLRRVLENLFRNSVEHGSTAGHDVTVTVATLAGEDGTAGFVVADDGPGVPETDRERVFDRGHSTGDGVGLGLAVVRNLAEAHGWRVTLGDGQGARFEFHDVDVVPPGN